MMQATHSSERPDAISSPTPRSAFLTKSYLEACANNAGFYVLASAVFEPDQHLEAREVLLGLKRRPRHGEAALERMDKRQKRAAAQRLADVEGLHLVAVGAPLPIRRQERARAACLRRLVHELHTYGVGGPADRVPDDRTRQTRCRHGARRPLRAAQGNAVQGGAPGRRHGTVVLGCRHHRPCGAKSSDGRQRLSGRTRGASVRRDGHDRLLIWSVGQPADMRKARVPVCPRCTWPWRLAWAPAVSSSDIDATRR